MKIQKMSTNTYYTKKNFDKEAILFQHSLFLVTPGERVLEHTFKILGVYKIWKNCSVVSKSIYQLVYEAGTVLYNAHQ